MKSNTEDYSWQSSTDEFVRPVQFTDCEQATKLYNACIALGDVSKNLQRMKIAKSIHPFTKDNTQCYTTLCVKKTRIEQYIRDTIKSLIER